MKKIVLNLKMNFDREEITDYEAELVKIVSGNPEVIICPPTCFLYKFSSENYSLCAQNVSEYLSGDYTGEVSAKQLYSMGVDYVLVNHRERKIVEKINEDTVFNKVRNVLQNNMDVIFCIGETLEDKKIKRTEYYIKTILSKLYSKIAKEELSKIIIAYEPEWLDSNRSITNEEIEKAIDLIKKEVKRLTNYDVSVLYGGNINGYNIMTLNTIANCDGFIIGESSLNIMVANDILKATIENY